MRGLAALIMLQGHAFDAWLAPQYRAGEWFWLSQFLGGFPAIIFLFLVGVSLALVLDRMRQKDATPWAMMQRVVKRGSWILLLAYAYRLEQYLVWYPAARWSDFFRIDTLNCIGASSIVIGLCSIPWKTRRHNLIAMASLAALVVLVTPFVYPVKAGLPDVVLDYLNGNGHPYYFSIFPWVAFALTGMTFGYALLEARERRMEARFLSWIVGGGILASAIALWMPVFPFLEYGFFDYSLTSPHYVFLRLGWLAVVLYGAYRWSTRSTGRNWSAMQTMGKASLLVYWVHMDLVYGRPFNHFSQALDLSGVLRQLVWLIPAMLLLATIRQYAPEWLRYRRAIAECATHRVVLRNGVCGECNSLWMESVKPNLD